MPLKALPSLQPTTTHQPTYKGTWKVLYKGKWHKVKNVVPPPAGSGKVENNYLLEGIPNPVPQNMIEDIDMRATASFAKAVQAKYKLVAAAYELCSDFADYLEVEADVTDYVPGHSGGWHEPAEGSEVEIHVTKVTFSPVNWLLEEQNDGDKETYDMLKKLKAGDRLKLSANGTVEAGGSEHHDGENFSFSLDGLTVKGVKWEKDAVVIECDEYVTERGRTPSQSYRGWTSDL
jgi:hypothetical protein